MKMIARDQVMPMLLSVCSSFEEPWQEYMNDPTYAEDLLYVHLGEFAHHLVNLQKAGETSEFGHIFHMIELLHTDGDAYTREAVTIGLLEGIQNVAGNNGLDPESFVPYLQPESARRWSKINAFWNGDTGALRD